MSILDLYIYETYGLEGCFVISFWVLLISAACVPVLWIYKCYEYEKKRREREKRMKSPDWYKWK